MLHEYSSLFLLFGVAIGMTMGSAPGIALDNIAMGIGIGLAVGAGLGTAGMELTAKHDPTESPDDDGDRQE